MTDSPTIHVLASDASIALRAKNRGWVRWSDSGDDFPAPDLVVCSSESPEGLGRQLVTLRARYRDSSILVVGPAPAPQRVVEAVRAGADFWYEPGTDSPSLETVLDQILAMRRAREESRSLMERLRAQGRQVQEDRSDLHQRVSALAEELDRAHERLENAHRELRGRVAQLVMLYRIGRDLTGQRNWDDALSQLLQSLQQFLGARGLALLLRSEGGRRLAARSQRGFAEDTLQRVCDRLRDWSPAPGEEHTLVPLDSIGTATADPCADRREPWEVTVVPLWQRDRDLGCLVIDKTYAGDVSFEEDFYFLITVQTVLTEEVAGAQAYHQLRRLQRFQERTLDHLGSGVLTLDDETRVRYANARARQMLAGRSEGAVLEEVVDLGSEQPDLKRWLAAARAVDGASIQAWLRVEGRPPIPVSLVVSRLGGESVGEQPGEALTVCVIEDLSERHALESERRRAAQQKELLIMAAEWAHDVRTPLTGILHSAELVADAVDPSSPKRRHLETVRREVARINDLVNNFLDYARPVSLKTRRTDLEALAREVADFLDGPARERGRRVRFEKEGVEGAITVEVDPAQFRQVLLNLVANALDASPQGESVRVRLSVTSTQGEASTAPPAPAACLEVIDRGSGVPAEHLDRVFVPFFTTKPEGTGLGLAISEKIVRAHDGTLRYHREGGDTIFRLVLPLEGHRRRIGEVSSLPAQLEARG